VTPSGDVTLGYVHVPAVMGAGERAYADSLRGAVRALASDAPPCGWIVDLRGNTGGNMWPMLAGLGPVVGPGRLGAFVDASGDRQPWFYEEGRAGVVALGGWYKVGAADVETAPHRFDPPHPPVAVLTDDRTASSGEAVAVAFRERPNARSFGAPTMGLTTGNQLLRLADGARLFVTSSVYADRTGRVYGGPLVPDVLTTEPEADARTWLAQQPGCTGGGDK
jgi:C-terminal processing protease CtpA/Prc